MSYGNKKSYILLKQKPLPTESFYKQCKKLSPNRCILWYPNFGITNENGKNVRPQSFNCSVCISRLPQFRIRKSNIFGWKNEVSTTVDMWLQGLFFSRNPSFSHKLISSVEYANIANHQRYY